MTLKKMNFFSVVLFGLAGANQCESPETNGDYIQCEEYFSGVYNLCVLNCVSGDVVCVSNCARVYQGRGSEIDFSV